MTLSDFHTYIERRAVKAAWCICSVKSCVIHAERFRSGVAIDLRRYTNCNSLQYEIPVLRFSGKNSLVPTLGMNCQVVE